MKASTRCDIRKGEVCERSSAIIQTLGIFILSRDLSEAKNEDGPKSLEVGKHRLGIILRSATRLEDGYSIKYNRVSHPGRPSTRDEHRRVRRMSVALLFASPVIADLS
jgi:hypothetical protein